MTNVKTYDSLALEAVNGLLESELTLKLFVNMDEAEFKLIRAILEERLKSGASYYDSYASIKSEFLAGLDNEELVKYLEMSCIDEFDEEEAVDFGALTEEIVDEVCENLDIEAHSVGITDYDEIDEIHEILENFVTAMAKVNDLRDEE